MASDNESGKPVDRINLVLLEETLRKDGWTFNATDFIVEAVRQYMKEQP